MKDKNIKRIKNKIATLQALLDDWDACAKDNEFNKNNLSTSERQDWVDEIAELKMELADEAMKS